MQFLYIRPNTRKKIIQANYLITINQTGIVTYNRRGQANAETKSITFRKETGGFLPIPQTQIDLSGGVLTQNAGWEGGDIYLN